MNKTMTIFAAASLSLLAGCAQYKIDQQLVAEPDPVALRLSAAVDKASAALATLASVEQARTPSADLQMPPSAPQELRRIISVDWTGPIEPIARTLADRAGYKLNVNGDRPSAPVVVSVISRERSVIEVLRDVGLQAGARADITVDPDRHLVELNYKPLSAGSGVNG